MNDGMGDLLRRIESAISVQRTGDLRNLLCDCNIVIQSLQNRLESCDRIKAAIRAVMESDGEA